MAMDPERRRQLLARREQMQQDLRRASRLALLGGLPAALDAAGTAYQLHDQTTPDEPDWRHDLVPWSVFHLAWELVTPTFHRDLGSDWHVQLEQVVQDVVAARAAPDDLLLFVSSNGFCPIVEISRIGFEQHLQRMIYLDPFEMWIAGKDKPWLIELRCSAIHAIG